MEIQQDFKELLELFNSRKVEYMIVGGHALAFYGAPRYTGDIDILLKPDKENAARVLGALHEFGFGSLALRIEDFSIPGQVIQLGVSPVRVDLLTSISGVSWESAYKNRETAEYGPVPTYFIGRKEFIQNKRAAGRRKDLADLEALGEI